MDALFLSVLGFECVLHAFVDGVIPYLRDPWNLVSRLQPMPLLKIEEDVTLNKT